MELTPWELGQLRKAERLTEWDGRILPLGYCTDDGYFTSTKDYLDFLFETKTKEQPAPAAWPVLIDDEKFFWEADYSRIIILDPVAFEELLNE